MEFIHQPSGGDRLGDYLDDNLSRPWTDFRAAVAFVKRSGTRHISARLSEFARAGRVELAGTAGAESKEGDGNGTDGG